LTSRTPVPLIIYVHPRVPYHRTAWRSVAERGVDRPPERARKKPNGMISGVKFCLRVLSVDKISRGPTIDGNASLPIITLHFQHHQKKLSLAQILILTMYSTIIFFPGSTICGVGGGVLLSWPKFITFRRCAVNFVHEQ